jgi:UDP-N-acetylglucosamine 2-epimerase (non-hydrolysing)
MYLLQHAVGIITDSGGVTEELTVLGIPCITLRDSTERPETVDIGTNVLVGNDRELLTNKIIEMCNGLWKASSIPEKWDGNTGGRIIEILVNILNDYSI